MGDDNIARARNRPGAGWLDLRSLQLVVGVYHQRSDGNRFSVVAWSVLKIFEDTLVNNSIDIVGFILLVIWVGALQIMLDEGKDLDWFASEEICVLAIIACIGF